MGVEQNKKSVLYFKNANVNRWLWRWHILAGLFCLPFLLLLSITGVIYLFKEDLNNQLYKEARFVSPPAVVSEVDFREQHLPLELQLSAVRALNQEKVAEVILPSQANQATTFRYASKGHARHFVYVNPYSAEVTGEYQQQQSFMFTIRKLHGELLLHLPGTLVIELVASWFFVLVITGLYVWWPAKKFRLSSYFTVRTNKGKSTLYRDLHAVVGFWISLFMLLVLAGGMPWTEVFGSSLKWVQAQTNTGYPQQWARTDLQSVSRGNERVSLDSVALIARENNLLGRVTVKIPKDDAGVFSLSNRAFLLRNQKVIHLDQYSGNTLLSLSWKDVGFLMDLRQVAMRLHQGEYGRVSWYGILIFTLVFTLSTAAGLVRYFLRKPAGRWGLPKVPESFRPGVKLVIPIVLCAIVFPLFGVSLILLIAIDRIYSMTFQHRQVKQGV